MASVLIIIEFSLAAGLSPLLLVPPPPDVPPANIRLMARTRNGSGLFYAMEIVVMLFPFRHPELGSGAIVQHAQSLNG